mmetsp:Transcript_13502/g.43974  ORF Transcript_13502/g.43974 Transcript_13502/m.43974 type:complete len:629 (+) Transcript_13502:59-1945(+)
MSARAPGPGPGRAIGFVDLDAFYAAVEVERNPKLRGQPVAVVQYETWNRNAPDVGPDGDRIVRGSTPAGLIAVSYPARARGVKRHMNANEARKACPDVLLVRVPTARGKADLAIYKDAGQRVVEELRAFGVVEKRSVDEVAIDVTEKAVALLATTTKRDVARRALSCSHLADSDDSLEMAKVNHDDARRGHDNQHVRRDEKRRAAGDDDDQDDDDQDDEDADEDAEGETRFTDREALLLAGAVVVDEARRSVMEKLGYSCSAGIATTKMMAKVACGLHKPSQQTIVLGRRCCEALLAKMPLNRLPGLGGALGEKVAAVLSVSTAGDLAALDAATIRRHFDANATNWLRSVAAGTYDDPVKDRATYQSFGASKTFRSSPLATLPDLRRWLRGLAGEITDRVLKDRDDHSRAPTNATISVSDDGKHATRTEKINFGRSGSLETIQTSAERLLARWAGPRTSFRVTGLGLGVSNFEPLPPEKNGALALMLQKTQHAAQTKPPRKKDPDGTTTTTRERATASFDPEVFDALPSDIRAEFLQQHQQQQQQSRAEKERKHGDDVVDPAVFDALPPEIQAELRDNTKRRQLLRNSGALSSSLSSPRRPPQQPHAKKAKKGHHQATKIDAFLRKAS